MEAVRIAILPFVWILWAQGAKHCHDLGKSGFHQIIPFYFIVMLFSIGKFGENEYGENPRGEGNPEPEYPFGYDVKNKVMLENEHAVVTEYATIKNSQTNLNTEQI